MNTSRIAIAALSISGAALVGIAVSEHYTDEAIIPVKGDVPTYGFGMTTRPDGSPVRMGDRTNPVEAIQRTLQYTQKADAGIKKCVKAPLHQGEYDLMQDFAYQYGVPRLCGSKIVSMVNEGRYAESCEAYLEYRFVAKYDCSTLVNGERNKVCWGVWKRQKERYDKCVALQ